MNKRILTLVLALVMVLGAFVPALAETEKITNPKVQWLIDNGIVEGRLQDDGKTKVFDLDKTITREEVTKLVIFHENANELAKALAGTKGKYSDVAADRWSNGLINAATVNDWVEGYPDKTFGPDRDITYAEVAAILVRLDSRWTAADEKNAEWPISYMKAAQDFGILKDVKIADVNEKAVREKVFEMMYNAFDGRYEAPIVNDDLGVISFVWADKIELNDDVEYTIDKNTIFIGESLNLIYNRADLLGSLVRVAIDEDNVLSHVVVLGQNKKAQPIEKWKGIAEGGVVNGDIEASADNDAVTFVGGKKLVTNDKTRVFVADVEKANFYEAKDVEDAIDVKKADHLKGVYAAYDKQAVTNVEYARVIVFSSGKTPSSPEDLRRITSNVGNDYLFTAEDTRAVDTEYTVKPYRDEFPYNYKFEKMDVVEFKLTGENGIKDADVKIDYSVDPIFEVEKVAKFDRYNTDGTAAFRGSKITLKDKNGTTKEFALSLDGVAVFTHTIGERNRVQVHFEDNDELVVDIISILDDNTPLRGFLPDGKPANEACGYVERYDLLADKGLIVQIKSEGFSDKYQVAFPEFFEALGVDPDIILDWAKVKGFKVVDETLNYKEAARILFEELVGQKSLKEGKMEICYQVKDVGDNWGLIYNIRFSDDFQKFLDEKLAEVVKCQEEALDFMADTIAVAEKLDDYNAPVLNDDNHEDFYADDNQELLAELRGIQVRWNKLSDCAKREIRAAELLEGEPFSIVNPVTGEPEGDLKDILDAVKKTDEELAKLEQAKGEMAEAKALVEKAIRKAKLAELLPVPSEDNLQEVVNAAIGVALGSDPIEEYKNVEVEITSVTNVIGFQYRIEYSLTYDDTEITGDWLGEIPSPQNLHLNRTF